MVSNHHHEVMKMRYVLKKLAEVKDPRQPWKVKHALTDILVMCIVAMLCGAQSTHEIQLFSKIREEWYRTFLEMRNGVPNRLTINRVLGLIEPDRFSIIFTEIMQYCQKISKGAVVSLDGKSFHQKRQGENALYMVSAWCNENNTIIGQVKTDIKSNELKAIPELLKLLHLEGLIVSIDAAGCYREVVNEIAIVKHADYVIGLKENQKNLHDELSLYAQDCVSDPSLKHTYSHTRTIEKGHGRIERRDYYLFADLSWLEGRETWAKLNSVVMVKSRREVIGKGVSEETRYYISSLTDVAKAAHAIRSHWGIENKLHWSLDVLMGEDTWPTKKKIIAANLATLRKLSLHFLRKAVLPDGKKMTGPTLMWRCGFDLPLLEHVLFNQPHFS